MLGSIASRLPQGNNDAGQTGPGRKCSERGEWRENASTRHNKSKALRVKRVGDSAWNDLELGLDGLKGPE